jgi:bifunctional non-homologous end joining protein LigD
VVVGYVPSTTSRAAVGSLALALPDGAGYRYVGKVGTGFTVKSAHAIKAELEPLVRSTPTAAYGPDADVRAVKWVRPLLVAEVEFRAWTASGHLRHASFRGLRSDKSPDEVTIDMPKPKQKSKISPGASREKTKTEAKAPVRLTHPDRVFWDDAGITKQGLADYYSAIWPHIASHVADRPLAFVRCPDGAAGSCFFQKHAWAGLDARMVTTHAVGEDKVLAVHGPEGLISLAQAAVLEIHPWGSTLATPDCPERLIFDLDPGDGVDFAMLEVAAGELRGHLEDLGLVAFVKTSGGKGLHVVVPVEPTTPWEDAKAFSKSVAEELARSGRNRYTSKLSKSTRKGRVFIDYLRNGRGATAVAAFSPRARPGAPVSTPLSWEELGTGMLPSQFTIGTIFRRLDALKRDPWRAFEAGRRPIP